MVCQAVLAIGPVCDQNHHSSALLDKDRMINQPWNISDMVLHPANDFPYDVIHDCFTDDHTSAAFHGSFLLSVVLVTRNMGEDQRLPRRRQWLAPPGASGFCVTFA